MMVEADDAFIAEPTVLAAMIDVFFAQVAVNGVCFATRLGDTHVHAENGVIDRIDAQSIIGRDRARYRE
jgi:hypothetical protein